MGSCCSSLSSRDVFVMLQAKFPTKQSQKQQRDDFYQRAVTTAQEAEGTRELTAKAFVSTINAMYDVSKISNEVLWVAEHLAIPSAIRFSDGKLKFKEIRQRAALYPHEVVDDIPEKGPQQRTHLFRHELRYALFYVLQFFQVRAVLIESADVKLLPDMSKATFDDFTFKVSKAKLEATFRVAFAGRSTEEQFKALQRDTANVNGKRKADVANEKEVLFKALVEFLVASMFAEEITAEDTKPLVPQPPAANSSQASGDAKPAPPRPGTQQAPRQFSDMVQSSSNPPTHAAADPQAERKQSVASESEPPTGGRTTRPPSEDLGEGTAVLSSANGQVVAPRGGDVKGEEGPKANDNSSTAAPALSIGGSSEAPVVTGVAPALMRPPSPPPVATPKPPVPEPDPILVPRKPAPPPPTPLVIELWKALREKIILEMGSAEAEAGCSKLFQVLDSKAKGALDEMDLYKGVQQHFSFQDLFPQGGLVLSQAVSAAFQTATVNLPQAQLSRGIESSSRFFVFMAALVAALDLHFLMKQHLIEREALRTAELREASQKSLTSSNQQQQSSTGKSPMKSPATATPATLYFVNVAGEVAPALSRFEQNRHYQNNVGSVLLEEAVDTLVSYLLKKEGSTTNATSPNIPPPVNVDAVVGKGQSLVAKGPSAPLIVFEPHIEFHCVVPSTVTAAVLDVAIEDVLVQVRTIQATTNNKIVFEKIAPKVGAFLLSLLYPPRPAMESRRPHFFLSPHESIERRKLWDSIQQTPQSLEGRHATIAELLCLQDVLCLNEITPSAKSLIEASFVAVVRLHRIVSGVNRLGGNNEIDNGDEDDEEILRTGVLGEDVPFYHFLLHLYASLCCATVLEAAHQPPLLELGDFIAIDLNGDATLKDYTMLYRGGCLESIGVKSTFSSDVNATFKGLQRRSDEDRVTIQDLCNVAALHFVELHASFSPLQRFYIRLAAIPRPLLEVDEHRVESLFVRLAGPAEDAVLTTRPLAAMLDEAFEFASLFHPQRVLCEGMWEAIVSDAVASTDLIRSRKPSMVEEKSFKPFLVFLLTQMEAYLVAEEILVHGPQGRRGSVKDEGGVMRYAVRKEDFEALAGRLTALDELSPEERDEEFMSLANGDTSAPLYIVAHTISMLSAQRLPQKKYDVWKRIAPLLQRLIADEEQRRKFFVFGIQKASSQFQCTVLELHRAIHREWLLSNLTQRAHVIPLLTDAVTIANTTCYPLPKDNKLLSLEGLRPMLVFLVTYFDVSVAGEEQLRAQRSRRRSSVTIDAAQKMDWSNFKQLAGVFDKNGITLPAGAQGMVKPSENLDALQKVFEVLCRGQVACTVEAAAHWAAHASVRLRFPTSQAEEASTPARRGSMFAVASASAASRRKSSTSPPGTSERSWGIIGSGDGGSGARVNRSSVVVIDESPSRTVKELVTVFGEDQGEETTNTASHHNDPKPRYPVAHPKSPWTQLRQRLPIGTDAVQTSRRKLLFMQFDVGRQGRIPMRDLVDGVQWILRMDELKQDIEPVVFRAVTAVKDSMRAFFERDDMEHSPQYHKSLQDAVLNPDIITPMEFRILLMYLYQYLELYCMFDELLKHGTAAELTNRTSVDTPLKEREDNSKVVHKANESSPAAAPIAERLSGGGSVPLEADRSLPIVSQQLTYIDFVGCKDLLTSWGLEAQELEAPDVCFRRINNRRDGIILFTDFAIWASKEDLHIEDPIFAD